jgi:hypothetical protein
VRTSSHPRRHARPACRSSRTWPRAGLCTTGSRAEPDRAGVFGRAAPRRSGLLAVLERQPAIELGLDCLGAFQRGLALVLQQGEHVRGQRRDLLRRHVDELVEVGAVPRVGHGRVSCRDVRKGFWIVLPHQAASASRRAERGVEPCSRRARAMAT